MMAKVRSSAKVSSLGHDVMKQRSYEKPGPQNSPENEEMALTSKLASVSKGFSASRQER
jgi:hypothetical protein